MTEQIIDEVRLESALKESRLAANLSIDVIAEKLNLNTSVIRDIEDNLDQIIADEKYSRMYLRGYLANYSKLVGLPLVEAFPQYQQLLSSIRTNNHVIVQPLMQVKSKSTAKVLCLLLLLLMIAAALYYGLTHAVMNTRFASQDNVSMQLPVVLDSTEEALATESGISQKISSIISQKISSIISSPVAEVNAKKIDLNANKVMLEANTEQALRLYFKDECWVEILDASGDRVAFGLYQNGNELNLAGTPPFNLKLGNAAAVDIFYQNQLIEKKFVAGKSSRFNLPE